MWPRPLTNLKHVSGHLIYVWQWHVFVKPKYWITETKLKLPMSSLFMKENYVFTGNPVACRICSDPALLNVDSLTSCTCHVAGPLWLRVQLHCLHIPRLWSPLFVCDKQMCMVFLCDPESVTDIFSAECRTCFIHVLSGVNQTQFLTNWTSSEAFIVCDWRSCRTWTGPESGGTLGAVFPVSVLTTSYSVRNLRT